MSAKSIRDGLQQGIYKVINPFVRLLIKLGLTPNMVTTIGLILNVGVAIIFVKGAEQGNRGDLSYVGWAGALILFAGIFDMLDGQVARLGNMSSTFGAMYDSVLDRYSEMIMFLGVCYYLVSHHYFLSSLFAFIALIGSMMVSYTRARAEGLGIECKGGLMQRPERVVLLGVSALACGITANYIGGDYKLFVPGISFHVFESMTIFTLPIAAMALLTNITAVRRLLDSKKALDLKDKKKKDLKFNNAVVLLILTCILGLSAPNTALAGYNNDYEPNSVINEVDTFPVPHGIKNQMFYVQRTPNTNTIVYELNYKANGQLNDDEPMHIFWIRYADQGEKKELNYIQRTFAYGLKVKKLAPDNYELRFIPYTKHPLYLRKTTEGKYYVFTDIAKKQSVLNRIYLKIDGGTFWHPNVLYIELKGSDVVTGKENLERIKP